MAIKAKVLGLNDFNDTMRRVASIIPGGELADALAAGTDVILEEAQKNIVDNGLVKSGALLNSGTSVKVNQYRVDLIFDVVYAAVHEYGLPKGGKGIFSATAKQIRFFWAKFLETGDTMWKALALKKGYTIPPRPYLTPAVRDKKVAAVREIAKKLAIALVNKIR